MINREPWPVRFYRRTAWVLGDLSTEAADAFAALYTSDRTRGAAAKLWLLLRALFDLLRGAAIVMPIVFFGAFAHDLRWAWRTLRARPGLSFVVIASIGLAIGANTAAFSVVNAFLWRRWGDHGAGEVVWRRVFSRSRWLLESTRDGRHNPAWPGSASPKVSWSFEETRSTAMQLLG